MAGTSGRVPDHQVNFFGQLCERAKCPPAASASGPPAQVDADDQFNEASAPPRIGAHGRESDRMLKLFEENQSLIQSSSLADFQTYLKTVKKILAAAARPGRAAACGESSQQQQFAGHRQAGHTDRCHAEMWD